MVGQVDPFMSVRRKMIVARIEFMGRLAAFDRAQLSLSPQPAGPSPLLIAHHLYEIDGLVLQQMRRVQTEENPQLVNPVELSEHFRNEQTSFPFPEPSLESILAGMSARREATFAYLMKLSAAAWERPFHFQDGGTMRFYQLCNLLPLHDQQHARQLETLKTRLDDARSSIKKR